MESVQNCGSQSEDINYNPTRSKIEWPQSQDISTNPNNSTLLYIAVEYVKEEYRTEVETGLSACESFPNYEQHVSTLDPNMSSVARYSPVYNDPSNCFNPVVIHQLVPSNPTEGDSTFTDNLNTNSCLEALPTVLCNADDINTVNSQYLHIDGAIAKSKNSAVMQNTTNVGAASKEQEVEILITDEATGISYSVNTQELLVEEQQLLEALSPDPLLDSELLTIDESTLKNNLPEGLIDASVNTSTESSIVTNFISDFSADSMKVSYMDTEDESMKLRKKGSPNQLECEDKLFFSIIDKAIPTRARATLPETYLKITKIEEEVAVFAKKFIRKRTQFGPVRGILANREDVTPQSNKLELLILDEGGRTLALDISDENLANWMCFIRKAETYEEQNLVVSQHENSLYFTVIRNIMPRQELKVGYSFIYANQHGFSALKKERVQEEWPCFECSEQFTTSEDLQNHLNVHEDKDKVKLRMKIWRGRKKLVKVAITEAYQCRICQQVFNPPRYSVLKSHLLLKHNIVDKCVDDHFFIVRNYKCEKCNVVFNLESLFKIHNLQHSGDSNDDNSDDESHHVCPSCNRKFPTQRQLILHVSIHSLPKYKMIPERFQCPICYTCYSMRERLQKHMLVHGPEESKPLQCPECKKRFMNNSALTCHLKTHITGENIYECPICKDHFNHVPKLKMHVQKHCLNNTYTCPQCNKKFKAYNMVRKHIRAFHSERKHVCQHCSKYFPTIDKLRMHLLRHSDHREFLCADCGKQFKRKDKLNEHCKRVHSEERENKVPVPKVKASDQLKKASPKGEPTDFHRFIYKCHHCLIGFKRRGMLVNHLAKRHPDISLDSVPELNLPILRATKDYYCQYCDKVYKSSSKRKAHILKNHPGAALPISNRKQGAYPEVPGLPNPSFSQTVGSVTTAPQNCNWCHKQYASKAKLLQHQRKEHFDLFKQLLNDTTVINVHKPATGQSKEDIEEDINTYKSPSEHTVADKILSSDAMEEFVDDPEPENQYCHLVNVTDNDVFQQTENSNLPNSHLYWLLTNTNKFSDLEPPR